MTDDEAIAELVANLRDASAPPSNGFSDYRAAAADLIENLWHDLKQERENCALIAERMETPYMLAVRYIAAEQNAKIAEAIRGRK